LRQEALSYKSELEKAKADLSSFKNIAAKEVNEIKQEVNRGFEPKGLNDADDLFDLDKELEEAEDEFAKLEKEKQEFKAKTKDLAKEAQEHLASKNANADNAFKHLKSKDS
jgi:hypothetical protein